ncbi:MAG: PmoA family protein [Planctomycetaceae bacterium]|jgi:hypothetical protein|nr:PmoA family protein [Planctomycetaceae bacterium]
MKPSLLIITLFLWLTQIAGAGTTLVKTDYGYDVSIDGKLFASYTDAYEGTPILWPLIAPSGHRVTRDFPLNQDSPKSEKRDHPHHRSFWFTHGEVKDSDGKIANFWLIGKDKIVHKKFLMTDSTNDSATIVTENDWVTRAGKTICRDNRTLQFSSVRTNGGEIRCIDFEVVVTAVDEKVTFLDTKEGTFGIRVAGTLDVDAKKRNADWGGTIVNSNGETNDAAWGKRANWVNYYGPVEDAANGKTVAGIAVMNHPSSFRYPTWWHVRDYGLFAANPFGIHDFENKKELQGNHELKKGESFKLRYKILIHNGTIEAKTLNKMFDEYKR